MRRLVLFFILLDLFIGCKHSSELKAQRLADTLAALRKICDFKPLDSADAYAFINKYYLPRLDTLRTMRKIFIHPIDGVDFNELFKNDKTQLENEYAEDSTHKVSKAALIPPPPPSVIFNKKFSWDSKKLLNTIIIKNETSLNAGSSVRESIDSVKAWHHRYGYGFMYISYPQYNSHTKRLVLREYLENNGWCGTGRERKFWFTKVPGGWKAY
jgi:hypothetical protein